MVGVQMHDSARDLFKVYVQCKIIDIQMRETDRNRIQGAKKFLDVHKRE